MSVIFKRAFVVIAALSFFWGASSQASDWDHLLTFNAGGAKYEVLLDGDSSFVMTENWAIYKMLYRGRPNPLVLNIVDARGVKTTFADAYWNVSFFQPRTPVSLDMEMIFIDPVSKKTIRLVMSVSQGQLLSLTAETLTAQGPQAMVFQNALFGYAFDFSKYAHGMLRIPSLRMKALKLPHGKISVESTLDKALALVDGVKKGSHIRRKLELGIEIDRHFSDPALKKQIEDYRGQFEAKFQKRSPHQVAEARGAYKVIYEIYVNAQTGAVEGRGVTFMIKSDYARKFTRVPSDEERVFHQGTWSLIPPGSCTRETQRFLGF